MTDQEQTKTPLLDTDIVSVINPDQGDPTALHSYTQPKQESLAMTIKNTMWLGIQEMTETLSRAFVSRTEHDPHASYKITL
jgi:hypothetical protein